MEKPFKLDYDGLVAMPRGQRIRLLRRLNDKTQQEVAEAIGVNEFTVSDWERGEYDPKDVNCERLADYFGVNVEVFSTPARQLYYEDRDTGDED